VPRAAEQLKDRSTEDLALYVPERDVDRADCVARDAAFVSVPPGLVVERLPDRVRVEGIVADHTLGHSVDDRLRREARLRELGDGLAPSDNAVLGRDLHQAKVPERVEIVRLRIADWNRLDLHDPRHRDLPGPDRLN